MAQVTLLDIAKRYGAQAHVLQNIDLDIADGEFMVFVGPSGCGKSTMLRMIAGLETITAGELRIAGKRVNETPPAQRGVAMVFQSYALYPHMTVFQNMAFSLEMAGQKKSEIVERVSQTASMLQIEHLLERKPRDLSGGQRQRVAIGRALVRKPDVFLFDEPLSNLDAGLRVQMRHELARLHRELKTTMIYVTHDQVEAMTLGERVAVFNNGKIEQCGTPLELYEHPANLFVAGFLGTPKMNFLPAKVRVIHADAVEVEMGESIRATLPFAINGIETGEIVTIGIRPEHVRIHLEREGACISLPVTVEAIEHLGDSSLVYLNAGLRSPALIARTQQTGFKPGDALCCSIFPAFCHLFDAQGRACKRDGV